MSAPVPTDGEKHYDGYRNACESEQGLLSLPCIASQSVSYAAHRAYKPSRLRRPYNDLDRRPLLPSRKLDRFQLAFTNDALMRLASALDAILYFAAALREFPENLVVACGG